MASVVRFPSPPPPLRRQNSIEWGGKTKPNQGRVQPSPLRAPQPSPQRFRSPVKAQAAFSRGRSERRIATDCFQILGVSARAEKDEVRQAYRRLARTFHPDTNRSAGASSKFMEIHNAYQTALSQIDTIPTLPDRPRSPPRTVNTRFASPERRRPSQRDEWDEIWDDIMSGPTRTDSHR